MQRTRDLAAPRPKLSEDDLRAKWIKELRETFELFAAKASADEQRFLTKVLDQWEGFLDDPEEERPAVPIVESAKIELDRMEGDRDHTLAYSLKYHLLPSLETAAEQFTQKCKMLKSALEKAN